MIGCWKHLVTFGRKIVSLLAQFSQLAEAVSSARVKICHQLCGERSSGQRRCDDLLLVESFDDVLCFQLVFPMVVPWAGWTLLRRSDPCSITSWRRSSRSLFVTDALCFQQRHNGKPHTGKKCWRRTGRGRDPAYSPDGAPCYWTTSLLMFVWPGPIRVIWLSWGSMHQDLCSIWSR